MADPITWGLINIVKKGVKGVQTTLDGVKNSVDTLPEDVQTKLDAFEVTIDELKKNVEDTLADVQETVENSPAGVFPPDLFSLSAQSTEEGIKLTYQASLVLYTDGAQENLDSSTPSDKKVALSRTKAVMFRYSDIETPTDITEGNLAFVDYDLFIKNGLGHNATKQKTNTIVGLTQNKTYYISAFPISTNNVYNLNAGANGVNRTKCQWTGTKGTLTVNVTQDYDYKPLGEYTATMTPTAGGQAITKTQSGAATIVFSGLEAGEYTLSFSAPQYFTAPQSQSVTVVAGQSQTFNAQYVFTVSLSDLSWIDIEELGPVADKLFSVGDSKEIPINGNNYTARIIGFKHDPLSDGSGNAPISWELYDCLNTQKPMNSYSGATGGFINSELYSYLETIYNNLESDLKSAIKSVKKTSIYKTSDSGSLSSHVENMKIWILSGTEVGFNDATLPGKEGSKYPIFNNNESRKKKITVGGDVEANYWLRSQYQFRHDAYGRVQQGGTYNFTDQKNEGSVSFCFCT